jgi:hypothetical protein
MRHMITRIHEALGSIIIAIVGQGPVMQLQPARVRSGGARCMR